VSRDPVIWTQDATGRGELLTSSKENLAVLDYVRSGYVWINDTVGATIHVTGADVPQTIDITTYPMGIMPYDVAKNLFDRIRIAWRTEAGSRTGFGSAPDVEYSLDAGVTWTAVVDTLGFPIAGMGGVMGSTTNLTLADDVNEGMTNISLDSVVGSTYLAVRLDNGSADTSGIAAGGAYLHAFVMAIFYNSTLGFDPF
jgi:hypothetical protein